MSLAVPILPSPEMPPSVDPRGVGGLLGLVAGAEVALPLREVKVRASIVGPCCRAVVRDAERALARAARGLGEADVAIFDAPNWPWLALVRDAGARIARVIDPGGGGWEGHPGCMSQAWAPAGRTVLVLHSIHGAPAARPFSARIPPGALRSVGDLPATFT